MISSANFYLLSFAYAALPLTVWVIIKNRADGTSPLLWCLGNGIFAITLLLMGSRSFVPDWLGFSVASTVAYLSYTLRFAALDPHSPSSPKLQTFILFAVVLSVIGAMADNAVGFGRNAVIINATVQALFSFAIAWKALRWAQHSGVAEIQLISVGYTILGIALATRPLVIPFDLPGYGFGDHDVNLIILYAAAMVAAVLGNLGFVGACLSRYEDKLKTENRLLTLERQQKMMVEAANREKDSALRELEQMLQRRECVVDGLVNEVLRPVQVILTSIERIEAGVSAAWGQDQTLAALRRMETLLRRVSTTVSNAVAEARCLDNKRQLVRQEIELDVIVALALAELSTDERSRLSVNNQTRSSTARVDLNLLRSAFRNILSYALLKASEEQQIAFSVVECDNSTVLLWEVTFQQRGFPSVEHDEGYNSNDISLKKLTNVDPLGLGMMVAERAVELHEGSLEVHQHPTGASVVRVLIPLY